MTIFRIILWQFVEKYAVKDKRIKIIKHNNNKGLGGARNTGIKHANSDYICFVDSDDYVSELFVDLLYQAIRENNSDVAICYFWQDENGFVRPYAGSRENSNLLVSTVKSNVLEVARQFNPGCTNRIYKHDLLIKNNICHPEKRYYEDVMFWLMVVYHSCKISVVSDRLYYYRQRMDSIMNTLSYKHIDDRFEFIRQIDGFVKNNILSVQNINIAKVTDDTLRYILIHLEYGESLILDSCVENIKDMNSYYADKIIGFSMDCNCPSLPTALSLFKQRKINRVKCK